MKKDGKDPARAEDLVDEIEDEEMSIVELTDEDGETTKFEYLSTIEYENENYVVLMALEEDEDDETFEDEDEEDEGEVLILRIDKGEDGEDIYVSCEDEETAQKVFDLFMEQLDAEDEE